MIRIGANRLESSNILPGVLVIEAAGLWFFG
jgi:hypothetical protein